MADVDYFQKGYNLPIKSAGRWIGRALVILTIGNFVLLFYCTIEGLGGFHIVIYKIICFVGLLSKYSCPRWWSQRRKNSSNQYDVYWLVVYIALFLFCILDLMGSSEQFTKRQKGWLYKSSCFYDLFSPNFLCHKFQINVAFILLFFITAVHLNLDKPLTFID